jgi:hypothetical protein
MMAARFERHVCRGTTGGSSRHRKRLRLGVRPAARRGYALGDDRAVAHDDAAHGGIGPCGAQRAARQRDGRAHVSFLHSSVASFQLPVFSCQFSETPRRRLKTEDWQLATEN